MGVSMTGQWMRASAVWVASMLVACDQVFDLTFVSVPDASDAPPPIDATPDGPEQLGFSLVQPITGVNSSASDGDPTLTSDMTVMYFKSTRAGGSGGDDLWYATRDTVSDPWSTPMRSKLSTTDHENACRMSPDGLTMWFRRSPIGGGSGVVMVTSRSSPKDDSGWLTPTELTELNTTLGDAQLMSTSSTQSVGYLSSRRAGTTSKLRIFRTIRANMTDDWGAPTEVSELVDAEENYSQSPWVTPGDLAIIFSSDREGCVGGGDLWLAMRASSTDPFGAPICLREVNSFAFEADPWISPDLRHIYFTSTASGGNYEIWEAHR